MFVILHVLEVKLVAMEKIREGSCRLHQFEKVELVQAVEASDSEEALEELTSHAESILKKLELPYE